MSRTGPASLLGRWVERFRSWRRDSGPPWPVLLRAAVTLSLLGLLVWQVDVGQSLRAMRAAFGPWLALVVLTSVLLIGSSILKWRALLRALGIELGLVRLFRFYTIGIFAGSLLPGIVGGDVVRWHFVSRAIGGRSASVAASILVERATGVVAIVVLAPVAILLDPDRLARPVVLVLTAGAAVAALAGIALATNRRLATSVAYRTRHATVARLVRPLYELHRTLRRFPARVLWVAMGYAVLFYLFGGLFMLLLTEAFSVPLPYAAAFSAQILVNLVGLLPISIGGLGLLQAGDVYFLGLYGVPAASALGISLVKQLVQYGYGIVGAAFLLRRSPWPTGEPAEVP